MITINQIFIVLLVVFLIYYFVLHRDLDMEMETIPPVEWINKPHPSGKYGPTNPAERLSDVITELGPPDLMDPTKGGVAIWKESTLKTRGKCWKRVEIHDEQIPHMQPAPHTDFLYTWYKIAIPPHRINDVRALSKSVTYDPLKKEIRARCHFMGANKATLLLAMYIVTGKMTLAEAKTHYGPYIMATVEGTKTYDPKAEFNYERELCS